jgi:hypothetical protein
MGSRTISIAVTNRTSTSLSFGSATTSEGPAATAKGSPVASGGVLTATAKNSGLTYYGNEGTFVLSGGALSYTVFYTHPAGLGNTTVNLKAANAGCVGGANALTYSGDPVNATMNLYQGVAVPSTNSAGQAVTGYAVPLAANAYAQSNNCQDLANSLYGANMRQAATVTAAYNQTATPYLAADFSGQMTAQIVPQLLAAWKTAVGPNPDLKNPDQAILNLLADYLVPPPAPGQTQQQVQMWIPEITYQSGSGKAPSVYELTGYSAALPFYDNGVWNDDAVETFLGLLVGGAHFVAISASRDFANQDLGVPIAANAAWPDLNLLFKNTDLTQRHDLANSHYCGTGSTDFNATGTYYLNIDQDFAPAGCGLILSLLFGSTVNGVTTPPTGTYNTFMQLEGWQANGASKSSRHMLDYAAYQQTLWNISTYGACPYSEKRATTVFLAPGGWTPQVYQTTRMAPYVGAYAAGTYPNGKPQDWLNTALVTIPAGAPALPSKYYG